MYQGDIENVWWTTVAFRWTCIFFLRCGMFYSKAKMKFLTDTHTPKMLYCSEFHLGKVFGGAFAHIVEISYHTVVLWHKLNNAFHDPLPVIPTELQNLSAICSAPLPHLKTSASRFWTRDPSPPINGDQMHPIWRLGWSWDVAWAVELSFWANPQHFISFHFQCLNSKHLRQIRVLKIFRRYQMWRFCGKPCCMQAEIWSFSSW